MSLPDIPAKEKTIPIQLYKYYSDALAGSYKQLRDSIYLEVNTYPSYYDEYSDYSSGPARSGFHIGPPSYYEHSEYDGFFALNEKLRFMLLDESSGILVLDADTDPTAQITKDLVIAMNTGVNNVTLNYAKRTSLSICSTYIRMLNNHVIANYPGGLNDYFADTMTSSETYLKPDWKEASELAGYTIANGWIET